MEKDTADCVLKIVREEVHTGLISCVTLDATMDELDLDSLAQLNVILQVENEFGVKFLPEVLAHINTLKDLAHAADALAV